MIHLIKECSLKGEYYGWILYTAQERIRNRHYIELYQSACKKYGMSVILGIYEQQKQETQNWLTELVRQEKPAFVVNRTRDYQLAKALEALDVRVYNHSQIAEIGNDKAKAYRYMEQQGIPIMPTVYDTVTVPEHYPVVVKSCDGHGGTEVFLI